LSVLKFFAAAILLVSFAGVENSQAVLWGNTYEVGNSNTATVNPTFKPWVTFTATEDMEISGARIYNSGAIVNSPEIIVDIRAVDGGGVPTGSVLGSGTFSPSGTGFQAVALPDVALTNGEVYAMEVSTATAGASFPWRLNIGATGGIQPFGDPDPDFMRGVNGTGPFDGTMVWVLDTDIGRTVGQPYVSSTAQNAGTSTLTLGQRFKYDQTAAGGDAFVESVTLRLFIADPAPANDVTVKLIDASGAVLATTTRDLSGEATGSANYQFDLGTPINLTDGLEYYVGMYSDGSVSDSVRWFGWNVLDDPDYIGASFQGADANGVLWGSQSVYTAPPSELTTRDYYFALGTTPVPEPGTVALLLLAGGALLVRRRKIRA